jgi:hypothetical protein
METADHRFSSSELKGLDQADDLNLFFSYGHLFYIMLASPEPKKKQTVRQSSVQTKNRSPFAPI